MICEGLAGIPGLAHGFSTRRTEAPSVPGLDFDLGSADDEGPPYSERRRVLCDAAGLTGRLPLLMKQVHGARIARVGREAGEEPEQADAALALRQECDAWIPAVRTADCVPLLLADRKGRAVAAVHAGWRGAAAGIAQRAVEQLGRVGVRPGGLYAALGPAIGPCCYEVGREVLEAVSERSGARASSLAREGDSGGFWLDLRRAVQLQLVRAGVPEEAVSVAPWCTSCHGDLFYSFRREGPPAGRMMAVIGWNSPLA